MESWKTMLRFACLSCGREHRVDPIHRGRKIRCRDCRAKFVIGAPLCLEEVRESWNYEQHLRTLPQDLVDHRRERRRLERHAVPGARVVMPDLERLGLPIGLQLKDLNLTGLQGRLKGVRLDEAELERLKGWLEQNPLTPAHIVHPALRRPFPVTARVSRLSYRLSRDELRVGLEFDRVPAPSQVRLSWLAEMAWVRRIPSVA